MANVKISGLTAAASAAGANEYEINEAGTSKKVTGTQIAAYVTSTLGSIATQDSNNVTITGGSITGITDLAIADGGTGASTEANARTNLGLGALATLSTVDTAQIAADAITATEIEDNAVGLAALAHGTDGELITYDATGAPAHVAVGTAGQVLTSNGVGAAPTMQDAAGGGLIFISSIDLANDATASFTGLSADNYDSYLVQLSNVIPATDAVQLWLRTSTDGGATYDSGASDYVWGYTGREIDGTPTGIAISDDADAQIELTDTLGSAAGEDGVSGTINIHGPHLTKATQVTYSLFGEGDTGAYLLINGAGARKSAADVDALQLLFGSGNLESGTITLYGRVNS